MNNTVLVCQNLSCQSCGSAQVLKAFQAYSISDTTIVGSGCLGQCGNGPMVLILPQEIWYNKVSPDEVKILVEQHLLKGQPVKSMLYRVKHPNLQ
ncbi:Ferredoxin, 2Fe-2S [Hyella patelloides LEGE 07179]|uniref:Ferredoxin, 2Fe-2S n=1 Tax=Hyella patelloides LEGE 07179 TaxID=945734 RepID=A0A563VQY7_9CYAN|nr:(2Fe-2S) ferredoxin domain-containing protein [Hyella patelloides]VEP13814.1 Ferredoxin, 2Fe-2S [Hyella patelloides LEGE 07179]